MTASDLRRILLAGFQGGWRPIAKSPDKLLRRDGGGAPLHDHQASRDVRDLRCALERLPAGERQSERADDRIPGPRDSGDLVAAEGREVHCARRFSNKVIPRLPV